MYDLSLLVTQRGLSLTEDMVVSSPTMPEHGRVGVKEGAFQRHTEDEMEIEEEKRER